MRLRAISSNYVQPRANQNDLAIWRYGVTMSDLERFIERVRYNRNNLVAKLAITFDKEVARDDKVVARNITSNEIKSINPETLL